MRRACFLAAMLLTALPRVTALAATDGSSGSGDPTTGVLPSYDDAYANWKNAGLASVGGIPTPHGGLRDGQSARRRPGRLQQHSKRDQQLCGREGGAAGCGGIHRSSGGSAHPYFDGDHVTRDGRLRRHRLAVLPDFDLCVRWRPGLYGRHVRHQHLPEGRLPERWAAGDSDGSGHPGYNFSWAKCGNTGGRTGCGAISLAADAAQGQTTIQLTSTSGFSVGQWVLIDEASGAGWVADPLNAWTDYGSVWAASDWLSSSGSPATGRVSGRSPKMEAAGILGPAIPIRRIGRLLAFVLRPTDRRVAQGRFDWHGSMPGGRVHGNV